MAHRDPNSMIQHQTDSAEVHVGQFVFEKRGVSRFDFRDPYHLAVATTWPRFSLGTIALYLLINLLFAVLYRLQPAAIHNVTSLADAFFFSVETLATVGYGVMSPATAYGHLVATAEVMTGTAFTAVMTGLIFVRFSKPKAKIAYSRNGVVAIWNGCPTLMFRLGNARLNLLYDVKATLNVGILEQEAGGEEVRRVHELRLLRSSMPFLALTWTIMHPLDEQSPLHGVTPERLAAGDAHLMIAIEARDTAIGSSVYDVRSFSGRDVLFNSRFVDKTELQGQNHFRMDLSDIHLVERDAHHATPKDSFIGQQPPA
jgi:inward rectifier potassium channel